jgi:inorganic triphosphatase YgiF
MANETELKLQLPPTLADFDAHEVLQRLAPGGHRRGVTKKLRAVYFDTADRQLAKRGIALRIRQVGRKRIQTLKAPTNGTLGLQTFREFEAEVEGSQPNLAKLADRTLARELRREIWPRLQPVFQAEFDRTSWLVPFRGSEIELSWDRGGIVIGDRQTPIHELELELKGGDSRALFGAAEELLELLPFRLGHATKAERGYALADETRPQPQKAAPVGLSGDDTVAIAFEKIVANCIAQMQANEAAILGDGEPDPEAIHQFRVALRRLRAIVGACRELIDDSVHAIWSIDLRWAQRACSPARDLDVLVAETLTPMAAHIPPDEAFRRFLAFAEAERAAARRQAVQALNNPRYAAMQLQLFQGLNDGAWRHALAGLQLSLPVRDFAEQLLQSRYKRVLRLGEHWTDLPDAELHRLRLFGKKLRYVAQAFAGLFKAKPARRFIDALSALQDCLGAVNDGAVGRQLIRALVERAANDGVLDATASQRIQGMVLGWQAREIQNRMMQFGDMWNAFAEVKRFWRSQK